MESTDKELWDQLPKVEGGLKLDFRYRLYFKYFL